MSKKVLDIQLDGFHLVCIRINREGEYNPFRVYKVVAGHRRQIAKYGDFFSVICFIQQVYMEGADTFTMPEMLAWARQKRSIL